MMNRAQPDEGGSRGIPRDMVKEGFLEEETLEVGFEG